MASTSIFLVIFFSLGTMTHIPDIPYNNNCTNTFSKLLLEVYALSHSSLQLMLLPQTTVCFSALKYFVLVHRWSPKELLWLSFCPFFPPSLLLGPSNIRNDFWYIKFLQLLSLIFCPLWMIYFLHVLPQIAGDWRNLVVGYWLCSVTTTLSILLIL